MSERQHFDAGRASFVAGEPLDPDYGKKAVRPNIWDDLALMTIEAQVQYERGRLAAAERRGRRRA